MVKQQIQQLAGGDEGAKKQGKEVEIPVDDSSERNDIKGDETKKKPESRKDIESRLKFLAKMYENSKDMQPNLDDEDEQTS